MNGNSNTATRRIRAVPRWHTLALPSAEIELRPDIPDALSNGTIPVDKLTAPLLVNAPLWDQAGSGDTYWLLLITPGEEPKVVDTLELVDPIPPIIPLHIPVDILASLAEGVHFVRFAVYTIGFDLLPSLEYIMVIDRSAPGGPILPAIVFDPDIEENGLTLEKLLAMPDQKLHGTVPNYQGAATGDVISLKMRLRPDGPEVEAGTVIVSDPRQQILVTYDRDTLERIDGWGTVDFYYYLADEAGNRAPNPAPPKPITMWIKGGPVVILPPLIPGFDTDGVVTDVDARPYLLVRIPAYEPEPRVGDRFIVHVGNRALETPPLEAGDIGNDPVLDVEFPYQNLFQSADEPLDDVFDVDVWYDIVRSGVSVAGPPKHIEFNLEISGGIDPDPYTPENEALGRASIEGASGGPVNIVKPGDTLLDAIVTVPWLNQRTPPQPSFKAGDEIQLYLDSDKAGQAYRVTDNDVRNGDDLKLTMPSADMLTHVGTPGLWYEATRVLMTVPPQSVTAIAPTQRITIQSLDDLPGGGKPLLPAKWLAGLRHDPAQIKWDDIDNDDGTNLRLYAYTNIIAGDTLSIAFEGHKETDPRSDPIPGTLHELVYTILPGDLLEKEDDSVNPPVKARYIDIHIPRAKLEPIEYGSATFDYTAQNTSGPTKADRSWIYVVSRH